MERVINNKVIDAFISKDKATNYSGSLRSTGEKLFSYNTVIAQYIAGKLVVNATKYSVTSSRHINLLKNSASSFIFYTREKVPIGTNSLTGFAAYRIQKKDGNKSNK